MINVIMIDPEGTLKVLDLLIGVLASFLWLGLPDLLNTLDKRDSQRVHHPAGKAGYQHWVASGRHASQPRRGRLRKPLLPDQADGSVNEAIGEKAIFPFSRSH